jgi:hypothetical protein
VTWAVETVAADLGTDHDAGSVVLNADDRQRDLLADELGVTPLADGAGRPANSRPQSSTTPASSKHPRRASTSPRFAASTAA